MDDKEIIDILTISALKNAIEFDGTPNKKAVMGKLMAQRKDLRSKAKEIIPLLDKIINEISEKDLETQKKLLLEKDPDALKEEEFQEEEKDLPELPNRDKYDKIIMRLAPYPSGALHIGNARMVVLNDEYVKRNDGELILFFDDTIGSPKILRETNPEKAKYVLPEAYDLIKEGLDWLDVKYSKIYYKSDRLDIYYEHCEELIKQNLAYVCFCKAGEFREKFKKRKKECPHRSQSIKKNLEEWNKMLNGVYHETEAVVRLKTGMDQKDPALRDQIIMRISEAEHPRAGNKYIIWPMLEFSWAVDDHLIGATHILRGSDLIKEDFIEKFIWDHYNWKIAEFLHYGRINFPDMRLSKTEARNQIEKGIYDGWDDPRTWSLQSLDKRGIKPEALRKALLDLGMSLSGITFSVNWLYAKNQDIIDEISNRYFFVENPVKVIVKNVAFDHFTAEPLLLPSAPEKGVREIECTAKKNRLEVYISEKDAKDIKPNDIFRLKDLLNVSILSVDLKEKKINANFHSQVLNRDFPIFQWVPENFRINVSILKPNGKLSEGYGEINLKKIPMRKTIQFERYGFVNPIRFENNTLFCYFTH
ncbi:MAG: glutamate--tRNA ligase [Candidatus Lokiarchaeota archaeon]|nr:glutamate--tRNA ligase [Candidatus Lokiarchaeota archaeon]MBD3200754.1 glutamate--tRNA ligase [Candidatus Lokiarchaeota archaeon]